MFNIVFSITLLVSLFAPFAVSPPASGPPYQPAACMFTVPAGLEEGVDVTCGYLTVPADHDQPDGPTLKLGVAVFKHQGQLLRPEPLFILQGGPGGSTLDVHPGLLQNSALRKSFDVVMLEQRGTLHSQPALTCSETDQYTLDNLDRDLSNAEATKLWDQALLKCHDRLVAQGINLSDFDSIQNAKDIETLRQALGYDKINLYGVSYGTLLALHYLRLFPDSLRTVILDGVVPPQANYIYTNVLDQDRVFKAFFEACRQSKECAASYPDLEQVFYKVIDELEKTPAHITLRDQQSGKAYPALMDGQTFYSGVYQTFYSAEFIPAIPRIIYKARDGDFDGFTDLLAFVTFDHTMSYGMYYSVNCAEEADDPPVTLDLSRVNPKILEFEKGSVESFIATCKSWNVASLGPAVDQPVKSDLPVLLLSGGLDPVTPESNAALAASTLSHSYSYTIPSGGHGQAFANKCADSIIQAFLKDPSTAPDSSCIADYATVDFWSPGAVVPVPLFGRVLGLDRDLLSPALLLALFSLGLLSALFFLPLAWLIKLIRSGRKPVGAGQSAFPVTSTGMDAPVETGSGSGCVLRLAGPAAMLNALVLPVFWITLTVLFVRMSVDQDMMVLWGVASAWRPLFLLPLLAILLSLFMLVGAILGWSSRYWSIWRKLYYSVVTLCALACVAITAYLGVTFQVFR